MASTLGMGQYRYSKAFGRHLTLQAGGFLSFQKSYSSLYPGIQLLTFNVARFEQIEWAKMAGNSVGESATRATSIQECMMRIRVPCFDLV